MTAKKTAGKKVPAKPKEQFIVTYDVDGEDPVKVLDTLDEAKRFIQYLFTGVDSKGEFDDYIDSDDIDKESIKLYKGVLVGKPTFEITFNF